MSFWTADRVAILKREAARPRPPSADGIAYLIGGGCNKNMVIGKLHRMGFNLTNRAPRGSLTDGDRQGRMVRRNEAKKAARLALHAEQREGMTGRRLAAPPKPEEPPIGAGVRFRELEPYHCKWPLNSKCEEGIWKSCGEPRQEGSPYCGPHHQRAFVGLPKRNAPQAPFVRENARHFNG